jgi:hypothetical protein
MGPRAYTSAIRGSDLCQAIVGPSRVRSHMSEGMRIVALLHTKMVE